MRLRRVRGFAAALAAAALASGLIVPTPASAAAPFSLEQIVPAVAPGAYFGYAVDISGDTAVVGMESATGGSVRVFVRTGDTWAVQQTLSSPIPQAFECFGRSVAIDGNTIVVGAPWRDIGANVDQGAIFTFTRSGSTWSYEDDAVASDGAAFSYFGSAVDVDGDTAVVGAPSTDSGAILESGAAYVFARSGATWAETKKLVAFSGQEDEDRFGSSVAVSGDFIAVGEPYNSTPAAQSVGGVWTFKYVTGTWVNHQEIASPSSLAFYYWGHDVDLDGDRMIVGSLNPNVVAVYTRVSDSWTGMQYLVPAETLGSDYYGTAVSICGTTAVVGAQLRDIGSNPDQGAAWVFTRSGSTWTQAAYLVATDGAANARFGFAVATNGTCALVGAPWAGAGTGAAYFYSTPAPVKPIPVYRFYNAGSGTHFYTDSETEKNHVLATWPHIYTLDGVGYYLNPANNTTPLTRLYNRVSKSHFYTASAGEAANALATWPKVFSLDGPTYAVNPGPVANSAPVYRFFNLKNGSHLYTASDDEKADVIAKYPTVYQLEGPAFWIGQ